MDPRLAQSVASQITPFNTEVCEGLACSEMKKMEQYMDTAMLIASRSFPKGLVYEGFARCSPLEEYRATTAKKYRYHQYELSKCDIYMVAFYFSLDGVAFKAPRYMYLPFVHRGGIVHIRGVKNHISPVLADIGISVEQDNIFIGLSKTRIIVERTAHTFLMSGATDGVPYTSNMTISVAFSHVHHLNLEAKRRMVQASRRNKAVPTLIHYVLCKYGISETFRKYADTEIAFGGIEIDTTNYPADQWVICQSTGYRPRGTRIVDYMPSDLRIAVPITRVNDNTMNLVAAVFYIVDHFPQGLPSGDLDYTSAWCIQLGHAIFKSDIGDGMLQEYIAKHLSSIEDYIDEPSLYKLNSAGITSTDIYGLFIHITETMHDRMLKADPANMWDKKLSVLDYVTHGLVTSINTMAYRIAAIKKPIVTEKDIVTIMNTTIRTDSIMKLPVGNGFMAVVSNPGDGMAFKITNQLVMQKDATGSRDSDHGQSIDPGNFLHASMAEIGSFGNLPKSAPTGKNRVNPTVRLSPDGHVVRRDCYREILDDVQNNIKRT